MRVATPEQFKAMAHPLRQRLLFALIHQATISQLATAMGSQKGNIAHHLKVLTEAGMVRMVATRTVRGGTERYYQRTARRYLRQLKEELKRDLKQEEILIIERDVDTI